MVLKRQRLFSDYYITNGSDHFKSNVTNETFQIFSKLSCDFSHVIYLLECPCHLQYVGRTYQTLRARMNNHRYNILHGYQKHSVSRHAASHYKCDFTNFSITPIEQIGEEVENG